MWAASHQRYIILSFFFLLGTSAGTNITVFHRNLLTFLFLDVCVVFKALLNNSHLYHLAHGNDFESRGIESKYNFTFYVFLSRFAGKVCIMMSF